jgi:hypothetical protein
MQKITFETPTGKLARKQKAAASSLNGKKLDKLTPTEQNLLLTAIAAQLGWLDTNGTLRIE